MRYLYCTNKLLCSVAANANGNFVKIFEKLNALFINFFSSVK